MVFHDVSCKVLQSCLAEAYRAIFLFSKILFKFLLPGQIIEPSFFMSCSCEFCWKILENAKREPQF